MNNFLDILKFHLNKYPLMQAEDIYKLAYQFYFGPAHFINDKEKAYAYLLKEAEETNNKDIELIDVGEYVRVSLINNEKYLLELFNAFVEFAKKSDKSIDDFIKLLDTCGEHLINNEVLYHDFLSLLQKMEELNYPAISHSQIYKDNYHPHYRLINKEIANSLFYYYNKEVR